MAPYTADMARLAAGRMDLKARICEHNAKDNMRWLDLALDYRHEWATSAEAAKAEWLTGPALDEVLGEDIRR